MVFAIAALLLHVMPGIQPGPQMIDSNIHPDVLAGTATASTDTKDATNSNVAHYNLDSVSLNSNTTADTKTNAKEGQSASLTAVSLENVHNSRSLSLIHIPEVEPGKVIEMTPAKRIPARKNWLALSLIEHGAASFDAYSTRDAISKGAVEDDPLMRPFAHSPAIYAAIHVGPVMLDILSRHMQRSEHLYLRQTWWIPQSVATFGFIFSGVHNINVASHH